MFGPILTALKLRQEYVNTKLISELVDLQKQQSESLQQNIASLQIGPFHSGMACLTDAKKEHRTHKERYELVQQAKQHFITSLGIYEGKAYKDFNDYFALGYIKSYIAFSWALLGKTIDARDWLVESHKTLDTAYELVNGERERLIQISDSLKNKYYEKESDPLNFKFTVDRAYKQYQIAFDNFTDHLSIFIQIRDYRQFVQQALEVIEKEELTNPSTAPSFHQYIPVAQKFMTDLLKSDTLQNDKLKDNILKASQFLDKFIED